MELEPDIAKTIVKNLKNIINHEINLFDTSGTIIASTDTKRVGTSHDGARLAASTKKTLTIDHDDQFEGAKKGINLPVLFNNSVVAIIGITGEREEVEPFGNIIKKMTEILIRENWIQMTNFNQRTNYSNLINMLISKTRDHSLTAYLASVLDIDLNLDRAVIIGEFISPNGHKREHFEELMPMVYNRIHPFSNSFFSIANQKVYIMMEKAERKMVNDFLNSLHSDIKERFGKDFVFGIGKTTADPDKLWCSYEEALTVVNWSAFQKASAVKRFEDLDIELLLTSISLPNAESLIQKVLGALSEKEIADYGKVIKVYTKFNGSITKGADELFIHKNTFQNKLNRLHEVTGYNPRDLKDYVTLSVAFLLKEHLSFMEDGE